MVIRYRNPYPVDKLFIGTNYELYELDCIHGDDDNDNDNGGGNDTINNDDDDDQEENKITASVIVSTTTESHTIRRTITDAVTFSVLMI